MVGLADGATDRFVWRGGAKLDVTGLFGNPERLQESINEAVRRMFERYPPR